MQYTTSGSDIAILKITISQTGISTAENHKSPVSSQPLTKFFKISSPLSSFF
jgi:hypothetical protein